jgi:predicted NAD/FAD-binding protein
LATVYQILEVVLRAVPRQSLRARSKWLLVPGPSVAAVEVLACAIGTNIAAATTVGAAKSTVAVLIFICDGSLSGAERFTTVTDCPKTSSPLPKLSNAFRHLSQNGGPDAVGTTLWVPAIG